MLIVSNVSNKQMNMGKMQIKGGYHGNLPQVTFPWHLSHWSLSGEWRQQKNLP